MGGTAPAAGLRLISNLFPSVIRTKKLWRSKPADRDGRRIWPGNSEFVRLPIMAAGNHLRKRPGNAAFAPRAVMDPVLQEFEWWWTQS